MPCHHDEHIQIYGSKKVRITLQFIRLPLIVRRVVRSAVRCWHARTAHTSTSTQCSAHAYKCTRTQACTVHTVHTRTKACTVHMHTSTHCAYKHALCTRIQALNVHICTNARTAHTVHMHASTHCAHTNTAKFTGTVQSAEAH